MSKNVAVLVVNPVNGMGLFQYLEAFFENKIPFKTFAVGNSTDVTTNSGTAIKTDDVIANLKGHESQFDALVFACGDAIITYGDNREQSYYKDMRDVVKVFNEQGKLIAGHCAAAVIFEQSGITEGKKVSVHPYGKPAITKGVVTENKKEVDKNLYTAQSEGSIWQLMPELLEALKK